MGAEGNKNDALSRLTAASTSGSGAYPAWGLSFTWDRYGNRTGQSVTAGTAYADSPSISTSTNRVTALGGASYSYDSNGNLTQDDQYEYVYDAENRMVTLKNLSGTTIATYAYDGNGARIVKMWGGGRTFDIYAGSKLISEFEDASSNTYSSGTTPGSAVSDGYSTLLYQHQDKLSTRLTTDNAGHLANQQGTYPFGEDWYSGGTADQSVERKYTTYKQDAEASNAMLNYAQARVHSARLGRFQTADRVRGNIGNPQRLNRYGYVMGDPINFTDRSGNDIEVDSCSGGYNEDGEFEDDDGECKQGGGGPGTSVPGATVTISNSGPDPGMCMGLVDENAPGGCIADGPSGPGFGADPHVVMTDPTMIYMNAFVALLGAPIAQDPNNHNLFTLKPVLASDNYVNLLTSFEDPTYPGSSLNLNSIVQMPLPNLSSPSDKQADDLKKAVAAWEKMIFYGQPNSLTPSPGGASPGSPTAPITNPITKSQTGACVLQSQSGSVCAYTCTGSLAGPFLTQVSTLAGLCSLSKPLTCPTQVNISGNGVTPTKATSCSN